MASRPRSYRPSLFSLPHFLTLSLLLHVVGACDLMLSSTGRSSSPTPPEVDQPTLCPALCLTSPLLFTEPEHTDHASTSGESTSTRAGNERGPMARTTTTSPPRTCTPPTPRDGTAATTATQRKPTPRRRHPSPPPRPTTATSTGQAAWAGRRRRRILGGEFPCFAPVEELPNTPNSPILKFETGHSPYSHHHHHHHQAPLTPPSLRHPLAATQGYLADPHQYSYPHHQFGGHHHYGTQPAAAESYYRTSGPQDHIYHHLQAPEIEMGVHHHHYGGGYSDGGGDRS